MAIGTANSSGFTNRYGSWLKDGLELMYWDNYLGSYPRSGTTIKDLSGNGNNGTLNNFANPPTSNSGFYDGAIHYDCVNDYIDFPSAWLVNQTEFTLSIFFKYEVPLTTPSALPYGLFGPSSGGTYLVFGGNVMGHADWYGCGLYLAGTLTNFYVSSPEANINPFIITDISKYYNLCVCVKPNEIKVYANGELFHSVTTNIGAPNYPYITRLGRYAAYQFWSGQIPVFMGYSRCLSASEVMHNYQFFKRFYN